MYVRKTSSKEGREVLRRSIEKLGDNHLNGLTEIKRMKLNTIVVAATVHINLQESAKKMKEQQKVLLTPMYQAPSQRHQGQVAKKIGQEDLPN